jgi:hypothetical protein
MPTRQPTGPTRTSGNAGTRPARSDDVGIVAVSAQVDDQQRHERQASEFGLELALAFGVREAGDPLGGLVEHLRQL